MRNANDITMRPAATVLELSFTADELLRALLRLAPERRVQILDSGGARGADEARFLIAGFDPFETIEARGDELLIERRGESGGRVERGSLLPLLDERLARYRVRRGAQDEVKASQLPVGGGACIASFAYDLARGFQRLRSRAPASQDTPEPDAALAFYDTLVVHDYARETTYLTSLAGEEQTTRARDALEEARLQQAGSFDVDARDRDVRTLAVAESNFTRAEYAAAVRRIKQHIYAGDIYQANLTQQFTCRLSAGDGAERVFWRLRRAHPASFAAFLRRREDVVVSASPERFLRVSPVEEEDERRVEAWPIKGTRARGATTEEDARLKEELLRSVKDAAENVMIVDLLRNDLGRVCRYGTVEVVALREVQEHPTLFHLVSKVRGRLRAEVTAGELLRATFPCGSITGAPKLRAMEIIDECERAPRGLSMGSIGYFSFDRRVDLSVAIRTMTLRRDRRARFNVGGGVVAESDPEAEYEESLVKARALLSALGATAGGGKI
ncbi:MAG TPA: aminodeoxychorismate synthase component I [Pyrinomonadaceae bacterium]|jgi:para-aminobenzoate synthetase component 1|nr:aminodeoxychorismate synthase component I [Pyrinomonadaceae bacterium]